MRLSDRWAERPLVVVFMRHFGCVFCREHLILLGHAYDDIRAAGGEVVSVFQYRAESTHNFCRSRHVPFECLGDPARASYRAVGLGRGRPREYLGLNSWRNRRRASRVGARQGLPKGDVAQRPGTFVIDTNGTTAFAHYNRESSDNPTVQELIDAVAIAAPARPSFD